MVWEKKRGNIDFRLLAGIVIFVFIIFLLVSAGVFVAIYDAFNIPALGFFGPVLGILFIIAIVVGLLERFLRQ